MTIHDFTKFELICSFCGNDLTAEEASAFCSITGKMRCDRPDCLEKAKAEAEAAKRRIPKMSICPSCNSEKAVVFGDDPAPWVRCMDCKTPYIPSNGPTSHETLKKIRAAIARIEAKLDVIMQK